MLCCYGLYPPTPLTSNSQVLELSGSDMHRSFSRKSTSYRRQLTVEYKLLPIPSPCVLSMAVVELANGESAIGHGTRTFIQHLHAL